MARVFSGRLLREARKSHGLRPEHLALKVDRAAYTLLGWEADRAVPPVAVLARLADTLNVSIDDLFVEVAK
jgi:transcriptional regulator with XRE-family HTH domain